MKKILLFLFVVVVFFGLALSVLAAESLSFYYEYDSGYECAIPGTISPGLYDFVLTIYGVTDGESNSLVFSGTGNFIPISEDGISYVFFSFSPIVPPVNFGFLFLDGSLVDMPGYTLSMLGASESLTVDVSLDLVRHYNSDFISSINFGLSSVLSWINSFSYSFMSGSLSPLSLILLIGISITLLFFVIRFICKSSWGC